jgi:putative restriction endonuclease
LRGFIGHTDRDWFDYLAARSDVSEVNFWRPGGRNFRAIQPGEPFFFRLKSPVNRVGGFGLFARAAILPAWRAWEVFDEANGVAAEAAFYIKLSRLAHRDIGPSDPVGCVAVADCTFFAPDAWLPLPPGFNPQNLSGSATDLGTAGGRAFWAACLERAAAGEAPTTDWLDEALARERRGKPQVVFPRLGQGAFRIAVIDAYDGACAVTGEHATPVVEAAHIKPWARGGAHAVPNGLPLRRDIHRLFDLGYVSVRPNGQFLVSSQLREEFANGQTYYALEGERIRLPAHEDRRPSPELLSWHADNIFRAD